MGLLDFEQFMASPSVQMGLGILANSNGPRSTLMSSVGRGAMQGMENAYQMQAYNAASQLRQQQAAELQRRQAAIAGFRAQLPEAQQAEFDVDPNSFLSRTNRNPQLVTVAGPDGRPMQRWLKPGEATGVDVGVAPDKESALPWYVRKGADGRTQIDPAYESLELRRASATRPPTPFFQFLPTPNGYAVGDARSGRISPASIDGKPVIRSQDDPALQGRIAGAKEDATTRAGAEAKRDVTMAGLPDIIAEAESILSAKGKARPTASVLGAGVDALGGVVGYSPDGAEQAAKLQAIGGQLVMKMPRMEGPQSNFDQQLYREMAGDVGNPMKPIKQRIAALDAIKTLNKKYMNTTAPSAPAAGAKFLGFE